MFDLAVVSSSGRSIVSIPKGRRQTYGVTKLRFLPALLWAALIFVMSSRSRLPVLSEMFSGVDKLAHVMVFAVLAMLLLWGAQFPRGKRAAPWVGLAAAYGLVDEMHQSVVPGRSVEVLDGVADGVGAVLGYLVVGCALRSRSRGR